VIDSRDEVIGQGSGGGVVRREHIQVLVPPVIRREHIQMLVPPTAQGISQHHRVSLLAAAGL
jgi:hypothetical protein